MGYNLLYFESKSGKSPFLGWLESLDKRTQARVRNRLLRIEQGNFGDHKSLGDGIHELRLFFGPGYRVYYGIEGNRIVILLIGGDKDSQTEDVAMAKRYWIQHLGKKETLYANV